MSAKVYCNGTRAKCLREIELTEGMSGAPIEFEFSKEWDGLGKTAVFTSDGSRSRILDEDGKTTVPHEILTTAGMDVEVAVFSQREDGTTWPSPSLVCKIGQVKRGAKPGADPGYPHEGQARSAVLVDRNLYYGVGEGNRQNAEAATDGNVVLRWASLNTSGLPRETYFRLLTDEPMTVGERYILSFDCSGVPKNTEGKSFDFKFGSGAVGDQFTLVNGRIVVPFVKDGNPRPFINIDDVTTVPADRPTQEMVGDGVILSNISIKREKPVPATVSETTFRRFATPELTSRQKEEIRALMDAYYAAGNEKDDYFYYDYDTMRNVYAIGSCIENYDVDGNAANGAESRRIRVCCSTFAELIWMGRDLSDFIKEEEDGTKSVKSTEEYSNRITKAFPWGYYFQFKDRTAIGYEAVRDSDGNITGYYGFKQPNKYKVADKTSDDAYVDSYSVNTKYAYEETENPMGQTFLPFMTAADMAQELWRMGCEISFDQLDVGDLVFTSSRWDVTKPWSTLNRNVSWKHITHVALVHSVNDDGTIKFVDCSDEYGKARPFIKSWATDSNKDNACKAVQMMSNVMMCARHPAAWGWNNMANIGQIDFLPVSYRSGKTIAQAIQFVPDSGKKMAVTKDLWYVYNNQMGTAKATASVEWNETSFDIKYKPGGE